MYLKNICSLSNKNVLSVLLNAKFSSKAVHFQEIPGPKYYPLLGPINEILTIGKAENLHLTIDNHHKKFGDVFKINLGGQNTVFISSADEMRTIFNHEGKYPKHILPPAWLYYNQKHNVKRGLLFMDDQEWLQYRQIMNGLLLKDFQWSEDLIQNTCDHFVSKIERSMNTESDEVLENLEDEIYLWSTYLILDLILGKPTSEQNDRSFDEKVWNATKAFQQVMRSTAKLNSVPPAFADKWNYKVWKEFEASTTKALEISYDLIKTLINEMESSDIGLLCKLKAEGLTEDVTVRLLSDLLMAAIDTSAKSVLWYLHILAKEEQLQERVRSAINEKPDDYESPLVRACLKEVLRLYPVAPFISRFLDSDAKLGNFIVPKGWLAIISLYSSGRNPSNFSHPLEFSPDRWLRSENKTEHKTLKAQASVPFAMGTRSCVGKKIAQYQIHCLITKILKTFKLKSQNTEEINLKLELVGVPDHDVKISFRGLE